MTGHFEVRRYDAAGRLGELEVPRAGVTVQTPALLPVVNPHVQTVQPATMESEFGAEMLITNSYVLHRSDELREPVEERGLHDLLDFSGAIMTDSGSFQLAEYGDIDVTTEEILRFQHEIGSDVGTPVDVPTPPDVGRERAAEELATTQERLETAAAVDVGDMLVTAPVQGSTYPDLRTAAAEHAVGVGRSATDGTGDGGLDLFPVGAVVPLLNDYRYDDVVDAVAAAKRGLGEAAPVHLFGAGHPMMFALAVALGCDLFDSAAYALYARDDRYLTVRGTEHLDELAGFPCTCPVCVEHDPADVRERDAADREELLARHNLHVTFGEMRTIRQAIRDGDLLELVDARARGHPAMVDGLRALYEHADQLAETDRVSKGTVFHVSAESARRPEVVRHHRRLDRFDLDGDVLLTEGDRQDGYDEAWRVKPPFGPYPPALAGTYPLTAETPRRLEPRAYEAAAAGVAALVAGNPDAAFTLAHRDWPSTALAAVPDAVATHRLGE